jgi:hypothetical protein
VAGIVQITPVIPSVPAPEEDEDVIQLAHDEDEA